VTTKLSFPYCRFTDGAVVIFIWSTSAGSLSVSTMRVFTLPGFAYV
jgi:hypothetical protein